MTVNSISGVSDGLNIEEMKFSPVYNWSGRSNCVILYQISTLALLEGGCAESAVDVTNDKQKSRRCGKGSLRVFVFPGDGTHHEEDSLNLSDVNQ